MKHLPAFILLAACTLLALPAFAAGNALKEISTAIEHSGFASEVKTTAKVHLHLHHVVNCLVGPHGMGFYPAAGNPCKGMGNGALDDLSGHPKARQALETALHDARKGLSSNQFKTAHSTALKVETALMLAKAADR